VGGGRLGVVEGRDPLRLRDERADRRSEVERAVARGTVEYPARNAIQDARVACYIVRGWSLQARKDEIAAIRGVALDVGEADGGLGVTRGRKIEELGRASDLIVREVEGIPYDQDGHLRGVVIAFVIDLSDPDQDLVLRLIDRDPLGLQLCPALSETLHDRGPEVFGELDPPHLLGTVLIVDLEDKDNPVR